MSASMRVERLRDPNELLALAPACDALSERMNPRSPFATVKWLALWWQHYSEHRLWVRDRFFVHVMRDEQGKLVGVAPLTLTERPGAGPLRSRNLCFFGSDKSITELRGLVCAPEMEASVVQALMAHLRTTKTEWDWLSWSGVRKGSDAHQALSCTRGFSWSGETTDYVLTLRPNWEEFRSSRSRNIKESLRKCYNSLKRAGHAFNFNVVGDVAEVPRALQRFFELHRRRAEAPNLVPHADVFVEHRARQLMLDLAASTSEILSLRVFQLEIAGTVVASRLGFVLGDELYLYFSGFDPAWAEYSVMTTTLAEIIKWAIAGGFRRINLSPGTDVSKTRWGATPLTTCSGSLISPTQRGNAVFRVAKELGERSRTDTVLGKVFARAHRIG